MSTKVKPNSESKVFGKKNAKRKGGKRKYGKSENPEVKDTSKDSNSTEYNDPQWRLGNATTILDRATKFVFNDFAHVYEDFQATAAPIVPADRTYGVGIDNTVNQAAQVPSVLALRFNPSPGSFVQGRVAAVTQQAQALYTSLSSMNAKTTQYAPQDLIMAILALGEVISTVEWLRRAFRLMYLYSPKNRAIPRVLVSASGFDYDIMARDYSNLVSELNTVIDRSMAITLPSNIDYFKACAAMYSDVFLDDESDMAQLYVFLPYSTWVLDETTSSEGSTLSTYIWQGYLEHTPLDPHVVIAKLGEMVDTLLTSSTLNFVYADIQNFAAKRGALLYGISPIVPGEALAPIYSEEALLQIQNITMMGAPHEEGGYGNTAKNDVFSDPNNNAIKYLPLWVFGTLYNTPSVAGNVINFPHMNPSDEEIMTALRFVAAVPEYHILNTTVFHLQTTKEVSLPDHYCVDGVMFYPTERNPLQYSISDWWYVIRDNNMIRSALSKFKSHPRVTNVEESEFTQLSPEIGVHFRRTFNGITGDLNYWTYMPYKTVRTINDGAMLSLFKVNEVFNKYQKGTNR